MLQEERKEEKQRKEHPFLKSSDPTYSGQPATQGEPPRIGFFGLVDDSPKLCIVVMLLHTTYLVIFFLNTVP